MIRNSTIRMIFLIGPLVLSALSACAPVVKISTQTAPEGLPAGMQMKRVAVLDFQGPGGKAVASWIESSIEQHEFNGKRYFTVLNDSRAKRLIAAYEQRHHGEVQPDTAARLGRQIGAEGIMFGEVTRSAVDMTYFDKTGKGCLARDKDGKCTKEGDVPMRCTKLDAHVAINLHMLNVRTARVVYSRGRSGDDSGELCRQHDSRQTAERRAANGRNENARHDNEQRDSRESWREERRREERLREERRREEHRREALHREERRQDEARGNDLIAMARVRALKDFLHDIAPRNGEETVLLKNDLDSIPEARKERFKQASAFAFDGRMDRACEIWQSMRDEGSRNLSVTFNLAICAEVDGRLDRALSLMTEADRSLPRPDYDVNRSLERIRSELNERNKMGDGSRS